MLQQSNETGRPGTWSHRVFRVHRVQTSALFDAGEQRIPFAQVDSLIADDQWYCIEQRAANDPAQDNGLCSPSASTSMHV